MKKLNMTKEAFTKSRSLKNKYGSLKYVSESGKIFKTDKGRIIKFTEAREYVDDNSIEPETAEEFIIFNDPDIFKQIAKLQKDEVKQIQSDVENGDVTTSEIADATTKAANKNALATVTSGIASSAINSATSIATSKAALGIAAAAGYKKALDGAAEVGMKAGDTVGDKIGVMQSKRDGYYTSDDQIDSAKNALSSQKDNMNAQLSDYSKISNLGNSQDDKRAMYLATQLQGGAEVIPNGSGGRTITRDQALDELHRKGYEINDKGIVNKITDAGVGAGVGAATSGGMSLFGIGMATFGWILGGVAAAAIITPYIYDKVRACTKTWLADIIAEIKFKADCKNYRCFYDLKDNKWVLTYSDIKWTSYLDNKLDQETIDDFFSSKFFNEFLNKCKQTFAILFSTSKNEVVFKSLPEIKDAPKELKDILVKIYDNKGAIIKNLFNGKH